MLFLLFVSFLAGIVTCLILGIYFIFGLLGKHSSKSQPWSNQYRKFSIPDFAEFRNSLTEDGSYIGLNLIFQFLFQELKDSKTIRKWAIQKLRKEFLELINSNTGKLLDNIKIRSIDLGKRLPVIKNIRLVDLKSSVSDCNDEHEGNNNKGISEVTLFLDLTYDGDFQLSVDVDTVFGRSAYLSVKILKLTGTGRLQFTNVPFKHWSFAFIEEPSIEFDVDSQIEGRSIAKLSSIITNQIRKSICRRHTLPSYKMRYKPFFTACSTILHSEPILCAGKPLAEGHCEVILTGLTNLATCTKDCLLYCSITLDSIPWSELKSYKQKYWCVFECEFVTSQSLGFSFADRFSTERYERVVAVTGVSAGSYAYKLNIRRNDLLTSINGVRVASTKYASKMIRASKEKVIVRIERFVNDKLQPPSSSTNTQPMQTSAGVDDLLVETWDSQSGVGVDGGDKTTEMTKGNVSALKAVDTSIFSVKIKSCQNPIFNEKFNLDIKADSSFMNVCVWIEGGKNDRPTRGAPLDRKSLLGHVSICLNDIALECALTLQGDAVKALNILPCESRNAAGHPAYSQYANLSGFEDRLCHGNILLKFNYFKERKPSGVQKVEKTEIEKTVYEEDGFVDLKEEAIDEKSLENKPLLTNEHSFHLVQFQSAVYCDFCVKKIWLKSASMCKHCKMICHKKCQQKCQLQTTCTNKSSFKDKNIVTRHLNPKNIMERKNEAEREERHEVAAKLLGRQLFRHLSDQDRLNHLEGVISATQKEIETESLKNMDLKRIESTCISHKSKSVLKDKIGNSDEKLKSLKLLMLQYCSGLQSCMDEEELNEKNDNEKVGKDVLSIEDEPYITEDYDLEEAEGKGVVYKGIEENEGNEEYAEARDELSDENEEMEIDKYLEREKEKEDEDEFGIKLNIKNKEGYKEMYNSNNYLNESSIDFSANMEGMKMKKLLKRSTSFESIFSDTKVKKTFSSLMSI